MRRIGKKKPYRNNHSRAKAGNTWNASKNPRQGIMVILSDSSEPYQEGYKGGGDMHGYIPALSARAMTLQIVHSVMWALLLSLFSTYRLAAHAPTVRSSRAPLTKICASFIFNTPIVIR